ncbi:DUF4185 domain-containing protein [Nonomuraea sp. KC401]|uniref:DUF4185 domain-containing protein n=1 Tax=unclassified Nonomuraea TaxID=2593643 RepID=UPI0010FEDDF6|nr:MULTISPECIES: DUF4185 domain-containing protein [unclassified Nonomuraea]NBE99473.1 DUF4185 domain-containing protein [Nonomuraea sp. K271]TLF58547.1 DUF4185 domain-containing protein [Nonomuraea sp. KC401]
MRLGSRAWAPTGSALLLLVALGGTAPLPAQATTARSPAVVVGKLTGPGSLSDTPGTWQVKATDLGIMWDNGGGEVLAAFGDTFGADWEPPGANGGDWRSQVLLRSTDRDLSDGMTFSSAATDRQGHAKELIPSRKVDGDEITVIPTAGVSVGSRQYLAYMSVRHWGPPGQWDTNYAGIAFSDDNGQTWTTEGGPRWDNPGGADRFQMAALVRRDGFVYLYGTPNGRAGAVHLARVPEDQVLSKDAYRYWTGTAWQSGPDTAAAPVVPAPAGELSVAYNDFTGRWLMTYLQGSDIVLRSAPEPTGPWSAPAVVASSADYPGLYGGFMHPWSSGPDLYLALSQWTPYNVYLTRITLTPDAGITNPNRVRDPGFERQSAGSPAAPWACHGNCGIDQATWGFTGDRNGFARHNSGWHDLHQVVEVEPDTTYTLTGWLRTSPNNDNGFFGVRVPGGAPVKEVNFRAVNAWTPFTVTFDSGSRTSVEVFAGIWTDNGDMWLQADEFSLVAS